MEDDFQKFDILKKGFLTYNEYKLLALSNLKKPLPNKQIGDTIFLQDVVFYEKEHVDNDYSELFALFSENDYITYGSLYNIMQKTGFACDQQTILSMLEAINDQKNIDYATFCKLLDFFG